jgi:CRISPR-associated protein, Cas1 family
MEQLSNLKHILHSKRANLYYIEHCRVMQKDGRVLYLTQVKKEKTISHSGNLMLSLRIWK